MANSKMGSDRAFGIVPILKNGEDFQFLLIQHNAGHWGFPKGHADPGESELETACREFKEETGISEFTVFGDMSFSEEYTFTRSGKPFNKIVVYYPAMVQSAIVRCQPEEIQGYAWLAFESALARLTFDGARKVLAAVHRSLPGDERIKEEG